MTICNLDGVNPLDRNSWRTSVARCCLPRSPGQPQHRKYQNRIWWWWMRHRSEVVLFSAECLSVPSLNFQIWLDCHTFIMNTMTHLIEVCVCVYLFVFPHDRLKTIADICFLLDSYLDWRKISDKFACHDHRSYTNPYTWSCSVRWMPGCQVGLLRSALTYGKRYSIRGALRCCTIRSFLGHFSERFYAFGIGVCVCVCMSVHKIAWKLLQVSSFYLVVLWIGKKSGMSCHVSLHVKSIGDFSVGSWSLGT